MSHGFVHKDLKYVMVYKMAKGTDEADKWFIIYQQLALHDVKNNVYIILVV